MSRLVALFSLFFVSHALSADTMDSASAATTFEAKGMALLQDKLKGPVAKVRQLLSDMMSQMEDDADKDEDVNEEMMCWCKTNTKEKTQIIADNTEKSEQLRSEGESLRAKSQQLNGELEALTNEVAANEKELETAISLRKKEVQEFNVAETTNMQSIQQLDGATAALSKNLAANMLQSEISLDAGSPVVSAVAHSIHDRHDMFWALHNEKERKVIADIMAHSRDLGFLQGGEARVVKAPGDIIRGAIASMSDSFKENLKQMQQDEADSQAAHEAMKKGKKAQIKAATGMIQQKTGTLADTDERAAAARQELDDTEEALAADQEYLKNVKEQCAFHEKEYAIRVETRRAEITAVSKALSFLASDEAKDLFTSSLGHTRRGEKLGSRDLKEYKEERETESMRSQTNAARKKQWGTSKRLRMLAQTDDQSTAAAFLQVDSEQDSEELPEAKKLASLAARTEAFWKAKFYNAEEAAKSEAAKSVAVHAQASPKPAAVPHHTVPKREKRNKLGLTAEQVKVRGNEMGKVGAGITKMKEALELQQGEENARQEWCVTEINTVEKQIDEEKRTKMDLEEKIELGEERRQRLIKEVKHLKNEQDDADVELQKSANDRRKANTAFQKTVMNQLATKRLLTKTLEILEGFYGKREKAAALLRETSHVKYNWHRAVHDVQSTANAMTDPEHQQEVSLNFNAVRDQSLKKGVFAAGLSKRAGSALLQSSAQRPHGHVAELLKNAEHGEDDAMAMIRAGLAMAKHGEQPPKAMLQGSEPAGPPPPPGFAAGGYSKSAASGGVLVMIQNIIDDTQAMIDECVAGETEEMKGYEKYVADSNSATEQRQEQIVNRNLEIGKIEEFAMADKAKLKETIQILAELRQHDIDLYGEEGCGFLLKNFEDRYMNRKAEIEGLKEAEAVIGAGGGNPEMTEAAGGAGVQEEKGTDFTPTENGVEAENDEVLHAGEKQPDEERAVIHMAGGTQAIDTTL